MSVQAEYNLLAREIERELIPACLEFGVGVIPFFPLAAGVLTGKYMPGRACARADARLQQPELRRRA